MRFGGAP
ncbi:hypothetical protein YPPY72_1592, partial [Yersinia pestis PY-72]